MSVRFRVAIPARYGSSRLPGKPLRLIGGRAMIEHTYRRARESGADSVLIATDDERIRQAALEFGADVCMTSDAHQSGTDRLAEVARLRGWDDGDIVVNLQGDEPMMPPSLLSQVAEGLTGHPDAGIATLCTPIEEAQDLFDPNVVKAVLDARGYALYFSRAPVPFRREGFGDGEAGPPRLPGGRPYWRHLGIYAYRVGVLRAYPALDPAPAEQAELLEQLRALWHGIRIHVQQARVTPPLGIDTEQDLARVSAALDGQQE